MIFMFTLVIAVLATYRVSRFITEEDGPGGVMITIARRFPKDTAIGDLIRCYFCTSVWVAGVIGIFTTPYSGMYPLWVAAVAGGAALIKEYK